MERLVVFTKYPTPGAVKTRLAPVLGHQGAALLHKNLTEQVLGRVAPLLSSRSLQLIVYYAGATRQQMRDWLGSDISLREQQGDTLGARMLQAMAEARAEGAQRVVLIGSDCPGITGQLVAGAFEKLRDHDLVLGPSTDGGYYLIGLRGSVAASALAELFTDITWSSSVVYKQTLSKACTSGLAIAILEILTDIDRPADLEHLGYHPHPQ